MMKKLEALRIALDALGEHLIVVCNGMIGREVYSIADRPSQFYMIGSMGIASSIALGLAHSASHRKVCVIEGDGNTLMGLGNLAQIAADAPKNFHHLCFDNGAHASTGDQKTISNKVALEKIALAAGYKKAFRAETPDDLKRAMKELVSSEGPAFLLATVEAGTVPGIARIEIEPPELVRRMKGAV
jgi:thiamine pyrophosphate-dependent acetolactate synthase large subunit-like protein